MKAIILGIATGSLMKIWTGNLGIAVVTALCTGVAAYVGQQIAKYIHKKLKDNARNKSRTQSTR